MAFPVTTIPPSSSGGGSSDFGDITGWPGASTDFVRGDGSDGPLSAADMIWAVATTTRSSNAFSGDLAVAPASLATGLIITWRVPSAPSGASTYNLNSLGAKDIYVRNAAAGAADLVANRDLTMRYDGTRWQIIAMGTLVPGDIPANNGLAYGFYLMTADDSSTTTPTLITWDSFSGSGVTNSSNEATVSETGFYEITVKLIMVAATPGGTCYCRLENWTSGSSSLLDVGRDTLPGSSQAYPGISWRGNLTANDKLRVYQFVGGATTTGNVDGDGSSLTNKACFWEIRRVR